MPRKKASPDEYKQVGIRFDPDKWARLKIMAVMQSRTITQVVDDAIDLYLEKNEQRTSKAYRKKWKWEDGH